MNSEQRVKILQDLIKIKSVNGNEREVAEYIQKVLAEYEIDSEIIPYDKHRANLIATLEGDELGLTLAFNGHMDVVEVSNPDEWHYDPFGAEIEDGVLYGRGATDMKGGLAALLCAFIQIKTQQIPFKGKLMLVATVGEEIGMLGSKQLVDEGYLDEVDAFIVAEPSTAERLYYAHKGSIQYELTAKGKTAHSSMPEYGINSIELMSDFIQQFNQALAERIQGKRHPEMGDTLNVFSVIEGGTQINSIPAETKMMGNARIVPQFDNQATLALFEEVIQGINETHEGHLSLNVMQNNFPVESQPDSKLVQVIQSVTENDIEVLTLSGATDASNFARLKQPFDLAIYGPGITELAHSVDESIEIADYLSFIEVFYQVAMDYLK